MKEQERTSYSTKYKKYKNYKEMSSVINKMGRAYRKLSIAQVIKVKAYILSEKIFEEELKDIKKNLLADIEKDAEIIKNLVNQETSPKNETLGAFLKQRRIELLMGQKKASETASISKPALVAIENNDFLPTPGTLRKVTNAYEIKDEEIAKVLSNNDKYKLRYREYLYGVDIDEYFGKFIKEERIKRGIKRIDAAKKVGFNEPEFVNIENGKKNTLTETKLIKIIRFYYGEDISMSEFWEKVVEYKKQYRSGEKFFGDELKRLRKEKNLTLENVSQKSKIPVKRISQIENTQEGTKTIEGTMIGLSAISLKTLRALCLGYEITLREAIEIAETCDNKSFIIGTKFVGSGETCLRVWEKSLNKVTVDLFKIKEIKTNSGKTLSGAAVSLYLQMLIANPKMLSKVKEDILSDKAFDTTTQSLGEYLKKKREEVGYTSIRPFCQDFNYIADANYSKWENNERIPKLKALMKLSEFNKDYDVYEMVKCSILEKIKEENPTKVLTEDECMRMLEEYTLYTYEGESYTFIQLQDVLTELFK